MLGSARPDCDGWTRRAYTVDVVQSVPGRGRKDDGRTTFEILLWPRDAPLTVGEEYLALLWNSGRVTGASAFAIVSGRIASSAAGVGELNGMRAEEAWETLLGWSRQQKP